jgi:hypothetical protein
MEKIMAKTALDCSLDELERVTAEWRKSDRALTQTVGERDAAEECLSQMYYLVTGHSPEWSNKFGHADALEDVGDVIAALKEAAKLGLGVAG